MAIAANRLTNYQSREYRGEFATFNAWPSFVVWNAQYDENNKGPAIKVPLSLARLVRLKEFAEKIKASEGPIRFPMEVWFWNKELKEDKYEATIAIGRDDAGVCYIEACSVTHKEMARLPLNDDRCIRVNGNPEPVKEMSEHGINFLIQLIDTMIPSLIALGIASKEGDGAPTPSQPTTNTSQDIPF